MSESYTIVASSRDRVGKGASRALRREGLIPAVIYGNKEAPVAISVPYKDIYYKIYGGGFLTNIATIELDGKKIKVLPKSYQLDPVKDFPRHVDFLRISENSIVNVKLPIHFTNEESCPGIKRGGVLNIVQHELECSVLAGNIPEAIVINLSNYQIGDSIHLDEIKLPKGAEALLQNKDVTIATISAPSGSEEDTSASEETE